MSHRYDVANSPSSLNKVGLGSQPKITSINLHELGNVSASALPLTKLNLDAAISTADFAKMIAASDQHEANLMNEIKKLCRESLKELRADQSNKIGGNNSEKLGVTHSGSAGNHKKLVATTKDLEVVGSRNEAPSLYELNRSLHSDSAGDKGVQPRGQENDPGINPGQIDFGFHLDRNGNAQPRSTPMDGEKAGSFLPDQPENDLPGVNGLTKQQRQQFLREDARHNIEKRAEELDQHYSYNQRVDIAAIEYRMSAKNAGQKFLKKDALKQLVTELKDEEVKRPSSKANEAGWAKNLTRSTPLDGEIGPIKK